MTRVNRRITVYQGQGQADLIYEHVQHAEWTADWTVLMIEYYAKVIAEGLTDMRRIHIPRERFYWFMDELIEEQGEKTDGPRSRS